METPEQQAKRFAELYEGCCDHCCYESFLTGYQAAIAAQEKATADAEKRMDAAVNRMVDHVLAVLIEDKDGNS